MKPYRLIYQMDSSGVLPASTDVNDYLKGIVGFLRTATLTVSSGTTGLAVTLLITTAMCWS